MRSTLFFTLASVFFATAQAKTDAELKSEFTSLIWSCTSNHPVGFWDLMDLSDHIVPTNTNAKCLLACAYKKNNMIADNGLVDVQHMYTAAEENMNGSEKRLENGKKLADICAKVNDVAVSDGNSGCDRASLLFGCVIQNAPPLGFEI